MPVSLERLIAEVEPNVVTEQLTRECIQIEGGDPETTYNKKRTMPFKDIQTLAFSFKSIAKIQNLKGLNNLTKLQLDNNNIKKIENIGHLTNLTWLDLSFNKLSKIEGLDTLTKLVDLSLFQNQISTIENLDKLVGLNVLSIGNNNLTQLDNVMYLRQFRNLRLVNLAGNPICRDHDYRSYVLSHIKDLTYLDYRRVYAADVQTAQEQHQDEMIELQEREDQQLTDEKAAADHAHHSKLMAEAHLDGVETLGEDMVREDPEWARLSKVPNLLDSWADIRDKLTTVTEEFKAIVLEAHQRKKAEHAEWLTAVQSALRDRDEIAQKLVTEFERTKKRAARMASGNPGDAENIAMEPKKKLRDLEEQLLELEMDVVEIIEKLVQEFDRAYSEIVDGNKTSFNAHFATVRDLQNGFFNQLTSLALAVFEKYNQESSDLETLADEARAFLQDKDMLMNALQASHDSHLQRIDALEDRLVNKEIKSATEMSMKNAQWAAKRNRDRIAEVINYVERNIIDLEEMEGEEEAADN
mmetsp:Transcript_30137/g.55076  ORF Transcript_30137/g.55076 Transcript_30137/m.55076 type:complete len:526 (-) Transcript_30137:137-1714(-)